MVGAIDVASNTVETLEEVADTLRKTLQLWMQTSPIPPPTATWLPCPVGWHAERPNALGAGAEIVRKEFSA